MKKINRSILTLFLSILFIGNTMVVYGSNRSGKTIYTEFCSSCHDGGFKGWITGAPELGEKEEWEPFLKKDLDELVSNVITGEKKHEKNGDCKDCNKSEIETSIKFIISQSR